MATQCCPPKLPRAADTAAAAELFKALSDPHRLRILAQIAQSADGVCVCDLNDGVPLLQPTVSHHLRVLKDAGLVESERCATWVYYRLAKEAGNRLRGAVALFSPKGSAHEDASVVRHTQAQGKRGILSHLVQRRAREAVR